MFSTGYAMDDVRARTMARKTRKRRSTRFGQRVVSGLRELSDTLTSGVPIEKRFTVRTVSVPEPGKYSAARIRATRQRLGLSQALFAQIVGVSAKLVEHWESGIRTPSAMARRLLDEINDNPGRWRKKLRAA